MENRENYITYFIRIKLILLSVLVCFGNSAYSSGGYYYYYSPKEIDPPVFFQLPANTLNDDSIENKILQNIVNDSTDNADISDIDIYILFTWKRYFADKYKKDLNYKDIMKIVYEINGYDENRIQALKNNPALCEKGSLDDFIINQLDKDILDYLLFVKKVNYITGDYPLHEIGMIGEESRKILQGYFDAVSLKIKSEQLDPFLKNRYLYFAYRLGLFSVYADDPEALSGIASSADVDSIFYYKILGYRAWQYYRNNNIAEALKLYSKIYANCFLLRDSAANSFSKLMNNSDDLNKKDWLNLIEGNKIDNINPELLNENLTKIERLKYSAENNDLVSPPSLTDEAWDDLINGIKDKRAKSNMAIIRYFPNREKYSQADWDRIIKKTKDDKTKAVLWFIRFKMQKRDYSVQFLKGIVEADPESPLAEIMLKSMIETIEKYNLYKGGDYKNVLTGGRKIKLYNDLADFCESTGNAKKVTRPAFWAAAGAYLSILDGNNDKAENLYIKALLRSENDNELRKEMEIIGLLIKLSKDKVKLSKDFQEDFVKNTKYSLYPELWILIGQKFIFQNDYFNAAKAYSKGGYEFEAKELLEVICDENNYLSKNNDLTAGFQNLFSDKGLFDENNLKYALGLKYFRSEKYNKAIEIFQALPAQLIDGKRIRYFEDSYETDPEARWAEKNILEFTKYIMELLADGDNPVSLYKLANIYHYISPLDPLIIHIDYNYRDPFKDKVKKTSILSDNYYYSMQSEDITQNEYFRYFWQLQLDSWPLYLPKDLFEKKKANYLESNDNFAKASKYYEACLEVADRELAAKCLVLLNSATKGPIHVYLKEEERKEMNLIYYLNKKYSDTEFYKEFIRKCPLIEKFQ